MPRRTALTELLGIEHAVIQAPMASAATPQLAAAVSGAGALGSLGSSILPADELVRQARIVREGAEDPEAIRSAPHGRPVNRLDEVRAAKQPVVRYGFEEHEEPEGAGGRQLEAQKGA